MRETPVILRRTDLIRIKSMAEAFSYGLEMSEPLHSFEQWLPISIAPEHCDLQVGAMDKSGVRAWTFPCRKRSALWFNACIMSALPASLVALEQGECALLTDESRSL
jgi:hypothetical protein